MAHLGHRVGRSITHACVDCRLHIAGVASYVAPSTDAECLKPAHPASSPSQEYRDLKILVRIVAGDSVDGWLLLTVMKGGLDS